MLSTLLAAAAFMPQGPGTSTAPVVINEFCYDDAGTDNNEFIELYNRSGAAIDISGWSIVNRDPTSVTFGGTGSDPTHVIPAGTVLLPNSFYLLGNAALVPTPTLGVSQILPANGLENGPADTIELWDTVGTIIDSVVYELGGQLPFGPHPIEGNGLFGDFAVGDAPFGPRASVSRVRDGYDNDLNQSDYNTLSVPTPGTSNSTAGALPFVDDFDLGIVGSEILGWASGFPTPRYVDPTLIDSQNQSSKPPSPQGGLAMSIWDSTGGGNAHAAPVGSVDDVVVECYAYFEPTMAPVNPQTTPYGAGNPAYIPGTYNAGDGEWWVMGVRGGITGNGNPPDVVGTYYSDISLGVGFRAHFVTGIAWAHYRTPTYSRLYLVDLKDGPSLNDPLNFNIIAGPIDIVAGVNDGWQRLRLHVQGNEVVGTFGGIIGCDDGQRFYGTTTTLTPGGVYFGYREAILYNQNCLPPLIDALDIHAPTTSKTFFGNGSALAGGQVPAIDAQGQLTIGANPFVVTGSNMAPFSIGLLAVGTTQIPAPGFPIAGAAAGSNGYLLPDLTFVAFTDALGGAQVGLAAPCDPGIAGLPLTWQWIAFDGGLATALQFGVSNAMETIPGN